MRKLRNDELNRISPDEYKISPKIPFVVVLDNVRSMNNIGSVFRTGDAFRIEKVCLCGITAIPPHKEIYKTALGATESVDWSYFNTTIAAISTLKKLGYVIVAVEQAENATSLLDFHIGRERKYAFVFGNEVKGVQQDVVDQSDLCLEIPQYGTKHSLNISVCAGIVLWDAFQKHQELG